MNDERLYINGQLVDLSPSSIVAKTLQVNDIASVDSRQASFTRTIDLPRTPNNTKIFNYLGIVGNTSSVPYQKNSASYYIGNECIIYEGWATVTDTTEDVFKINIVDGVVDFYKAIENRTFSDISLSGLTHTKNLAAVLNSWTGDTEYKYILADYSGKATYSGTSGTTINVDYLTPSVNAKYLWDSVFERYGFTYTGSVFDTDNFKNLWLTFPKGITSTEDDVVVFDSDDCGFGANGTPLQTYPNTKKSSFLKYTTWSTMDIAGIGNNTHLHVDESSTYRITVSGSIHSTKLVYFSSSDSYLEFPQAVDIWLCKNADQSGASAENVIPIQLLAGNVGTTSSFAPESFSKTILIDLASGEDISIVARSVNPNISSNFSNLLRIVEHDQIHMSLSKVAHQSISFDTAFADFKIKDFINEIIWRFGLTIFKDKYTNNYDFLTLGERIKTAGMLNWSDKFQGVTNEKYIYGSYAQKNFLKYTYNDAKNDHKDGSLSISNVNLEESKNIIQSKIFAPELEPSTAIPLATNVYPLWDKQVSENNGAQEIQYKGKDKRFYFMRCFDKNFSPKAIGSEQLIEETTFEIAPVESYAGLGFNDIVQNYYSEMSNILNQSKLILAKFWLRPRDVSNFDFRKLYFIEQLGGYFLVNKINNYRDGFLTDVELIKVEYHPELFVPEVSADTITVTGYYLTDVGGGNTQVEIFYTTTLSDTDVKARFIHPAGDVMTNSSPLVFTIPHYQLPHSCKIQNVDGTINSNTVMVYSVNIE